MFVYSPSADGEPAVVVARRARRMGGRRRLGRERRHEGGARVRGDAHGADVISTASVNDFRNVGKRRIHHQARQHVAHRRVLYGTENDYHSISFNVMARTELFEHNTQFQLDYAHNFD